MRNTVFIIAILLTSCVYAQTIELFKGIEFDSTYKIVGIAPDFPGATDKYERFWFVIDKVKDLQKAKDEWVFTGNGTRVLDWNSLRILTIKDGKPVQPNAIININQLTIVHDGKWCKFDLSLLIKAHEEFPLKYREQQLTFKTMAEFEACYDSLVKIPGYLFMFSPFPPSKYEGSFTITLDRTDKLKTQIDAEAFLKPILLKYGGSNDFEILYPYDNYNLSNEHKMRMKIVCNKQLFDSYSSKLYEVGAWVPAVLSSKVYWRE